MQAIIRDRNGNEEASYTLSGKDPLDCDYYAEQYANAMGFDIAEPDGWIPDGCEDFSVIIQETPGSAVCWSSANYMIRSEEY